MIGLLFLFCVIKSELEIVEPSLLKLIYPNDLKYSVGNIGHVPYGQTIIGEAILADPLNACLPIKNSWDSKKNFFLVAQRGDCPFVTKAQYAQIMGASLMIIIDNIEENVDEFIM